MIGKLKKSSSFAGCIRYVTGKDEAKILASDGVLLGTNTEMTQSFELQRQLNPRIKKPVGHIALSFKPEDKPRNTRKLRNAERAKYEIHNAVKDALKVADSWQKFKNELAKRGVCLELVYKDKERTKVQGIRFSKDGYSFKGTQISRGYSFGKLNARFEGTENLLSARASSAQQYEQGNHKNNGISSIGLFAPANAQTFESFPEDESPKKKKKKRRRGFSL